MTDLVEISLPPGELGLVLEPIVKFSKHQKGCKVRKWTGVAFHNCLSPGTEIVAVDKVLVKDRKFKDIVKMIKESSTRRLTLGKSNEDTDIVKKESSPANLIRAILLSDKKNRPLSSPTNSVSTGSTDLQGLGFFDTPASKKNPCSTSQYSQYSDSTSTSTQPPKTPASVLSSGHSYSDSIHSFRSNTSSNDNDNCNNNSKSNNNRGGDRLFEQEHDNNHEYSTSKYNSKIETPYTKKEKSHKNSTLHNNTSSNAVSFSPEVSMTPSKVREQLSLVSPLLQQVDRRKQLFLAAQEQNLHLQNILHDRENEINELKIIIDDLKRKSRGNEGQIVFLQFKLEKLQIQQKEFKQQALVNNNNNNTNIQVQSSTSKCTPDRQAWLIHWNRSRPVLSNLVRTVLFYDEGNNDDNVVGNGDGNDDGDNEQKNIEYKINRKIITNISKDSITNNVSNPSSTELLELQRSLEIQKVLNGKLEDRMRQWVEDQIVEVRALAMKEVEVESGRRSSGSASSIHACTTSSVLCVHSTIATSDKDDNNVSVSPSIKTENTNKNITNNVTNVTISTDSNNTTIIDNTNIICSNVDVDVDDAINITSPTIDSSITTILDRNSSNNDNKNNVTVFTTYSPSVCTLSPSVCTSDDTSTSSSHINKPSDNKNENNDNIIGIIDNNIEHTKTSQDILFVSEKEKTLCYSEQQQEEQNITATTTKTKDITDNDIISDKNSNNTTIIDNINIIGSYDKNDFLHKFPPRRPLGVLYDDNNNNNISNNNNIMNISDNNSNILKLLNNNKSISNDNNVSVIKNISFRSSSPSMSMDTTTTSLSTSTSLLSTSTTTSLLSENTTNISSIPRVYRPLARSISAITNSSNNSTNNNNIPAASSTTTTSLNRPFLPYRSISPSILAAGTTTTSNRTTTSTTERGGVGIGGVGGVGVLSGGGIVHDHGMVNKKILTSKSSDNDSIRDDIRRFRGTLKKVRDEVSDYGNVKPLHHHNDIHTDTGGGVHYMNRPFNV